MLLIKGVSHDCAVTHMLLIVAGEGEAPTFTSALEPIQVADGDKTTLTVTFTAKPLPNVQWFHNEALLVPTVDMNIVTDSTQSCLVIEDTMLEDAGLYKVILTNPHGDAVSVASVEVLEEEERVEQMVTQIAEVIIEEEVSSEDESTALVKSHSEVTIDKRETSSSGIMLQQAITEVAEVESVSAQTLADKLVSSSTITETQASLKEGEVVNKTANLTETFVTDVITEETTATHAVQSHQVSGKPSEQDDTYPSLVSQQTTPLASESVLQDEISTAKSSSQVDSVSVASTSTDIESSVKDALVHTSQIHELIAEETELSVQHDIVAVEPQNQKPKTVMVDEGELRTEVCPTKLPTSISEGQLISSKVVEQTEINHSSPLSTEVEIGIPEKSEPVNRVAPITKLDEQEETLVIQSEEVQSIAGAGVLVASLNKETTLHVSRAPQVVAEEEPVVIEESIEPVKLLAQTGQVISIDHDIITDNIQLTGATALISEEDLQAPDAVRRDHLDTVTSVSTEILMSADKVPDRVVQVAPSVKEESILTTQPSTDIQVATASPEDVIISSSQSELIDSVQRVDEHIQEEKQLTVTEIVGEEVVDSVHSHKANIPMESGIIEGKHTQIVAPEQEMKEVVMVQTSAAVETLSVASSSTEGDTSKSEISDTLHHIEPSTHAEKQETASPVVESLPTQSMAGSEVVVDSSLREETVNTCQVQEKALKTAQSMVEDILKPVKPVSTLPGEIIIAKDKSSKELLVTEVPALISEEPMLSTNIVGETPVHSHNASETEILKSECQTEEIPAQSTSVASVAKDMESATPIAEKEILHSQHSETKIEQSVSERTLPTKHAGHLIQEHLPEQVSGFQPEDTLAVSGVDVSIDSTQKDGTTLESLASIAVLEEEKLSIQTPVAAVESLSQAPVEVVVSSASSMRDIQLSEAPTGVLQHQLMSPNLLSETVTDLTVSEEVDISATKPLSEIKQTDVKSSETKVNYDKIGTVISEVTAQTSSSKEVVSLEARVSTALLPSQAADEIVEDETKTASSFTADERPLQPEATDITFETSAVSVKQEPAVSGTTTIETPVVKSSLLQELTSDSTIPEEIEVVTRKHTEVIAATAASAVTEKLVENANAQPVTAVTTGTSDQQMVDVTIEKPSVGQQVVSTSVDQKSVQVSQTIGVDGFTKDNIASEEVTIKGETPCKESVTSAIVLDRDKTELFDTAEFREPAVDSAIPEEIEVSGAKADVSIIETSKQLDFDLHQDVELSVEYSAAPTPVVTWYKDDQEVQKSDRVM